MDKQELKRYMADWYQRNNKDPIWKELRNKQRAQKRKDNKQKAVEYMGGKCQQCGNIYPDCCYDFHHKNPTESNDVPSTILHRSWKRIIEELNKCIMVCSNCHRIIHSQDGYIAHKKRNFQVKKKYNDKK